MLHWLPPPNVAFAGARPVPVMPGDRPASKTLRGRHALTLAYAAQRRRAAADPTDAIYWKAAAAVALDKAIALRRELLKLP